MGRMIEIKEVYTSQVVARDFVRLGFCLNPSESGYKVGYLIKFEHGSCFGFPVRVLFYQRDENDLILLMSKELLNDLDHRPDRPMYEDGRCYPMSEVGLYIRNINEEEQPMRCDRPNIDYSFYSYFKKTYEQYLEELQKAISVNVVGSVTLITKSAEDELSVEIEDHGSKITIPIPDFSKNIINAAPINEIAGFVTAKYITKSLEGILNRPEAIKPWIRSVMKDVDLNE